jgi:hypothetical protein
MREVEVQLLLVAAVGLQGEGQRLNSWRPCQRQRPLRYLQGGVEASTHVFVISK